MRQPLGWLTVACALPLACTDTTPMSPPDDERTDSAVLVEWGTSATNQTCDPENPLVSCNTDLVCTPETVEFEGTVYCSIGDEVEVVRWRFTYDGGEVEQVMSSNSWTGPMVISGNVSVEYTLNGNPDTKTVPVSVTRRNWSWVGLVGGSQGALGEIDQCFQGEVGLTSGQSCTASDPTALFTPARISSGSVTGYTAEEVPGSGINGGVWYISNPTATMQLKMQINRLYRTDGSPFPMTGDPDIVEACDSSLGPRNYHQVNTVCTNTVDFGHFISDVWDHEQSHVTAGVQTAQQSSANVYSLWEPIARGSSSDLQSAASAAYAAAEQAVRQAMLATHDGQSLGPYYFWVYGSSGWWQQFVYWLPDD